MATPFIIQQDWPAYTPEQHETWTELYRRRMLQLEEYACIEFLEGMDKLCIKLDHMPNFADINALLTPRTDWQITAVNGFMPADAFFEMMAARQFPTITKIRPSDSLDYSPEPDIFHDVFGHVPMHALRVFADFVQQYGEVSAGLTGSPEMLEQIGRLFWYTVEFGVIRQGGKNKFYGSGLISSNGEATNAIRNNVSILDFDLDTVLDTPVKVDEFNHVLYAIVSFDQIYEAMEELRRRNLSSGLPGVPSDACSSHPTAFAIRR
jgi:phenylalanine-4-hydroxylase